MARTKVRKTVKLGEMGRSGLTHYGGYVYEEFLSELKGSKAVKVFTEMAFNDPVIGAMLFAIDMLLRQMSWDVQAASAKSEDVQAAEFLESNLHDMSCAWTDFVGEVIGSELPFGHAAHEIVYKRRQGLNADPDLNSQYSDGYIGWAKLPGRAVGTFIWQFDEQGRVRGITQTPPPNYQSVSIPLEKLLLFTVRRWKGNPESVSALRNAYRPWYYKRHIEEVEAIGIERDLAGLPLAYVPMEWTTAGADANQKAAYENIKETVINLRRDELEGIVMPQWIDPETKLPIVELKLLTTGGQRQFDTTKVIERYNQVIAMTLLADFILIGHEQVGSFSLASSKTKLFAAAIGGFADGLENVLNRQAVPRLFNLNPQFRVKELPKLRHGDVETTDLKELGEYLERLTNSGAMLWPNQTLLEYLLEQANLPIPDEATLALQEAERAEAEAQRAEQAEAMRAQTAQTAPQAGASRTGDGREIEGGREGGPGPKEG